ncbi:toll-like receptor Tollo [Uloborus diversus]|uniref:toll-like receptor Tollo n=1 Tax=Uloborus diversus TaxID=327109 RepID=UPI0024097B17|nr:toll-like receptor Tollo [Uloborus diversus]
MEDQLKTIILICVVGLVSNAMSYMAPSDCQWTTKKFHTVEPGVLLTCHVSGVGTQTDSTNFSLIQSTHTVGLTIICDDRYVEGRLKNSSLAHLKHLQSLRFERCAFSELADDALNGLTVLKNFTVHTGKLLEGRSPLSIGHRTFTKVRELEYLDLAENNIVMLPEYPFCGLINLKYLNLSRNALQDVKQLGLEERKLFPCIPELQILDLSYNRIKYLTDEILSSLRRLRNLTFRGNQISQMSPYALIGLQRLHFIDLSNNKLSEFHPHFFHHSTEIREILLSNNSIAGFPSALFRSLSQLSHLDVSHNIISELHFLLDSFKNPNRLSTLNLSFNRIRRLEGTPFQSLLSLQVLHLQDNQIEYIAEKSFTHLSNLKILDLTNNKLRLIEADTFNGLISLQDLVLRNNHMELIHSDALMNLTRLRYLSLQNNSLTSFPVAINKMEYLQELDLSLNSISNITNDTFENLKSLVVLDLKSNLVGNLSRGTLRDQYSLRILDLSKNRIQSLEHGIFDDAIELEQIELNDNLLSDINGLFMNLQNLRVLNVSRNNITWFDYALVPSGLVHLDMHSNRIDSLGNYFELETVLKLRYMDASFNRIKEINAATFPNALEAASLRNNSVKIINPFTFMSKTNLTMMDLRNNNIQNLDINALRLISIPINKNLPTFYLSENPLHCDCTMEWLQRINNLDDMRQYPRIVDLENVLCHMTFPRQHALIPITRAKSNEFLCKYKSHCFALCHCCEFDACDCEMVCPENCTCYSDQTWNTNIVDCSSRRYSRVPARIPMDVTDLYLDGNDMSQVGSHSFIGRKNMRILHLNGSNIHIIRNRTFNGLQNLLKLHLEHNYISVIQGHEFTNLTSLQELYLSYNRLSTINNSSFSHLKFLRVLHLDHNNLIDFLVWNLNVNHRLTGVKLSHNSWTCSCEYLGNFQDWLVVSGSFVTDREDVRCYKNQSAGLYVLEFNSSACSNHSALTYYKAEFSGSYIPVMIIAPIFLLIAFCLIIFCIYNSEMKIWIYSRYGIRLFQRNNPHGETEKLFDAFLSYCKKDEAFVSQMLAPELEDGTYPHRLCLRYRDLPMAEYVAEAISEAIECSRCTVAVVSEQYLKSEWCTYELKAAHHENQCNRRHRLIIVLLDKISLKELDPDVRICLRSASLVHWGDRRFWEKLRFSMPEPRLHKDSVSCKDFKTSSLRRSSISNSVKLV